MHVNRALGCHRSIECNLSQRVPRLNLIRFVSKQNSLHDTAVEHTHELIDGLKTRIYLLSGRSSVITTTMTPTDSILLMTARSLRANVFP
jgi:hypothetical protein